MLKLDLKQLIVQIDESNLEQYLKDWFKDGVLSLPYHATGYDTSNGYNPNDTMIEYDILTDDTSDYRIIYNEQTSKFGLESRGIIMVANKPETRKEGNFILNWADNIIDILRIKG